MERSTARPFPSEHTEIGELIDGELMIQGVPVALARGVEATIEERQPKAVAEDDEVTVTPGVPVPAFTTTPNRPRPAEPSAVPEVERTIEPRSRPFPAIVAEDDERTVQADEAHAIDEELRTVCAYEELPLPVPLAPRTPAPRGIAEPAPRGPALRAVSEPHPTRPISDTHLRPRVAHARPVTPPVDESPVIPRSAAYLDADEARALRRIEAQVTSAVLDPDLDLAMGRALSLAPAAWTREEDTAELASDVVGIYGASEVNVAAMDDAAFGRSSPGFAPIDRAVSSPAGDLLFDDAPLRRRSGFHDVAPQRYIRTVITEKKPETSARAEVEVPADEGADDAESAKGATHVFTIPQDPSKLFPLIVASLVAIAGTVMLVAKLFA